MTEIQVTEEYKERMAARETRKTKAQLLEEIEALKDIVKEKEEELKKFERLKVYDDAALDFAAIRDSLIGQGFTEDQAMVILKEMVHVAGQSLKPSFRDKEVI